MFRSISLALTVVWSHRFARFARSHVQSPRFPRRRSASLPMAYFRSNMHVINAAVAVAVGVASGVYIFRPIALRLRDLEKQQQQQQQQQSVAADASPVVPPHSLPLESVSEATVVSASLSASSSSSSLS